MTKTIEERAERYGIESANLLCSSEWSEEQRQRQAKIYAKVYSNIATEQHKIDVEKACEWLKENADKYIYDAEVSRYQPPQLTISGKCWEDFRKAMEGNSGNKEEIPSKLTWQDIEKIENILTDMFCEYVGRNDFQKEAYYTEVLKRFNESKED